MDLKKNRHFSYFNEEEINSIFTKLVKARSNLSLYSLYYAEACNEFAGPNSTSLRPGNTAPTFRRNVEIPETSALPFDQLAGRKCQMIFKKNSAII